MTPTTESQEPRCRAHGCLCEQPETCRFNVPTPTEEQFGILEESITRLFSRLIPTIGDDYRASDDPDDDIPGMSVTVGATVQSDGSLSWSYQTGDNSFTGGAYSHPTWSVVSLYRESDPAEVARECVEQIAEQLAY